MSQRSRSRAWLRPLLLLLLAIVPCWPEPIACSDERKVHDRVILRTGRALSGRVTGRLKTQTGLMLQVDTEFGQILVPRKAVKSREEAKHDRDGTFAIRGIRVVSIKGLVERRAEGAQEWQKLNWNDKYQGRISDRTNALIKPGDTVRTGDDGRLEFMPHKDVWVRLVEDSEVYLPADDPPKTEGSMTLRRGRSVLRVTAAPRGQVYRVRTPLTLLATRQTTARITLGDREEAVVLDGSIKTGKKTIKRLERATWGGDDRGFQKEETEARAGQGPRRLGITLSLDDLLYVPAGSFCSAARRATPAVS